MFRIGIMLFFLLLLGSQVLSYFGSEDGLSFTLFVVVIVVSIAVLKVSLDFVLHKMKHEEEEEEDALFGDEHGVRTFESIDDYEREAKRRHDRRLKT